jgi:AMMECR1 domain-containing protein
MKRVRGPEALRIGTDGAVAHCGEHRGLLLPQVGGDGRTPDKFFDMLLRKAGLGPEAASSPQLRLYRFQADVFGG